jgi:hypothetical protein
MNRDSPLSPNERLVVWLAGARAEFARVPDGQKAAIFRIARFNCRPKTAIDVAGFVLPVMMVMAMMLLDRFVGFWGYAAAIGIFIVLELLWLRAFWRDFCVKVRRELNSRGFPVCNACGYNLTGLTNCECPECGGLRI